MEAIRSEEEARRERFRKGKASGEGDPGLWHRCMLVHTIVFFVVVMECGVALDRIACIGLDCIILCYLH